MPKRATIYTYPWDLSDEGVDNALNTIADTAGLNSVSLAQSYHVSTYFLPHNPRRPLYWGEEARSTSRRGFIPLRNTSPKWLRAVHRPKRTMTRKAPIPWWATIGSGGA